MLDPKEGNFATIQAVSGAHFGSLFRKVTFFRLADKEQFRQQVASKLSPLDATHLLDLCSSPVEPRATWKERTESPKNKAAR